MGAEHSRLEDPRKAEVTKQGDIRHGSVSGATPKGVPGLYVHLPIVYVTNALHVHASLALPQI